MKRLTGSLVLVTVMLTFMLALPVAAQDELVANKTIITNWMNLVYDQMNLEGASALLADEVAFHEPTWTSRVPADFMAAYPLFGNRAQNVRITPYTMIAEGDLVVVPYLWEGTRAAVNLNDRPEIVSGNGVEVFRLVDGKIAEIWRRHEQHAFSILGTEEDYRGTINMVQPVVTLAERSGIPSLDEIMIQASTDAEQVMQWVQTYNIGLPDESLVTPDFAIHTCPCDDGTGAIDLPHLSADIQQMTYQGNFMPWTPVNHEQGFMTVTENGLTALMYDMHPGNTNPNLGGIAIFRSEAGHISEVWSF
ncbi:MAG: nuclear transport factor 2 family protein [Anaerolineae bacterium]|nr:nuclear transport factor 2 family protein [Anaerolineae bacterium]